MLKASLLYENGTVLIRGIGHIPFGSFDPRAGALRTPALYYRDVTDYLRSSRILFDDRVLDLIPSQHLEAKGIRLRDYQHRALKNWIRAGMKGCIVLPTGAGKTIVALKAMERINLASLVLVPTIDLMDQWCSVLEKAFGAEIGRLGGGDDTLQAITVSTYDSAYVRGPLLGNRFALAIFDEVHHLAAPGYRCIAEQLASPYRLGLTATIEREDGMHAELPKLVGGVVFRTGPERLAREMHLAAYTIERREVKLLPQEVEEYRKNYNEYLSALRRLGFRMGGRNAFQRLVMISGRSKLARYAILARNRAMNVALNSRAKFDELREVLGDNAGVKKTIIFTQHNSLVHEISSRFLIPFITHKSCREEREDVLDGFREGRYRAIVTSKVLDEGVDVPDAELGIIVSGTGSGREFVQRLGRLLRPKEDGRSARLVEIVSAETREAGMSRKRKKSLGKTD